ncbi:unnamed protein product [Phytophthora lilii]|uniref:Unnamed protein product n=1 Tax=Phytophthora lilii TaxID=2077276 RepID=A0A9W6UB45_9STRA|nr:unnamed protein product [Phytophthora lilii]
MVDTNQVPVVVNTSDKTLLKTRLLDGEKIVAEYAETPAFVEKEGFDLNKATDQLSDYVSLAGAIALFAVGETTGSDNRSEYFGGGGALIGLWILFVIYYMCRKPAPEVVIGTRSPQFASFAIKLTQKADRIQLLEDITTLLSKNQ